MIRTSHAHLNVAADTHEGMTGKNNEDRYAVASYDADNVPILCAVLADGIGGHRGGEVAAELAVNHIMQNIARSDGRFSRRVISQAVAEASDSIASHAASEPALHGMGATCAIAWIVEDRLFTAYVGDSRIYLLRGDRIQQLTIDHSWVQEAIERGILSPEKARDHPNVHVIRRYLGSSEPPEPDLRLNLFEGEGSRHADDNQGMVLEPNDIVLLCTDGLTDMVWNDEILETVRANPDLKEAARALVALANERGGHDNTTVILIGMPRDYQPGKSVANPKTKTTNWLPWILAGFAGMCILFVIAASILTFRLIQRSVTHSPTSIFAPASQVIEKQNT